jgi:hypothetical protein
MVLIPQQGLPSLDLLVHSKRLVLRCPEDPPAAKACGSIDGPIPSDQRQSGRHLILDHPESRLGKFGQRDKWSFCLTAARMAAEQEKR